VSSLVNPPIFTAILPKRSIGAIYASVTVEETAIDELEITQHPVQEGAAITDHAYKQPVRLSLKVLFDDNADPLAVVYQNLLDLQQSRELIDVVTGKKAYSNMLIRSVSQTTSAQTEHVLSVTVELQEIIIAKVSYVNIPARAKQSQPSKTDSPTDGGRQQAKADPQKTADVAGVKTPSQSTIAESKLWLKGIFE
jgi:hypothetical protein